MLKNKWIVFFLLMVLFFVLEIAVSPVRGYFGMHYCAVVGFALMFAVEYLLHKKYYDKLKYTIITSSLLGVIIFNSICRIPPLGNFNATLISLPDAIFHVLGVIFGYAFFMLRSKMLIILTALALNIFILFFGYSYWFNYLNYGYFVNVTKYKPEAIINYVDSTNNILPLQYAEKDFTVIDFWHSRCGACFQKFPVFQQFYDANKNNAKLNIIAFNLKLESDTLQQAFNIMRDYNYSFPVGVITDSLVEKFEVKAFPTTIILNRTGEVIFKGDVDDVVTKIKTL
jgi:thiol-disulfide isomerase/thioredoxin